MAEKKVSSTKIEFYITSVHEVKELYLVGSDFKLGAWDETKALKLEFVPEKNVFYASKMFPVGTTVEYKILAGKSWDNVEKGYYGEEIANRCFIVEKGLKVEATASNFA